MIDVRLPLCLLGGSFSRFETYQKAGLKSRGQRRALIPERRGILLCCESLQDAVAPASKVLVDLLGRVESLILHVICRREAVSLRQSGSCCSAALL